MRRTRLGRTEQRVSAIALGTWSYGGARTVDGQPVGWSGHDDRLAAAALVRSWEVGIQHWDTADVYGDARAERLIGTVWDRVPREEIFLATKIGWDPGPYAHAYHPRQVRERLERSLTCLRTDRIDLYYFHRCEFGPEDRYLDGAVEVFEHARQEGKIRFIGLSDWSCRKLFGYAQRLDPDVVQPYRNVVDDDYEESGLREWVASRDAGVAFFSPLKHGLLLGKYETPPRFPAGDMRRRVAEFGDVDALRHYSRCREALARYFPDHPEPVLHGVLGALLTGMPTGCVLLGQRNPDQVERAAQVGEPLIAEDAAWVKSLYRRR